MDIEMVSLEEVLGRQIEISSLKVALGRKFLNVFLGAFCSTQLYKAPCPKGWASVPPSAGMSWCSTFCRKKEVALR